MYKALMASMLDLCAVEVSAAQPVGFVRSAKYCAAQRTTCYADCCQTARRDALLERNLDEAQCLAEGQACRKHCRETYTKCLSFLPKDTGKAPGKGHAYV